MVVEALCSQDPTDTNIPLLVHRHVNKAMYNLTFTAQTTTIMSHVFTGTLYSNNVNISRGCYINPNPVYPKHILHLRLHCVCVFLGVTGWSTRESTAK